MNRFSAAGSSGTPLPLASLLLAVLILGGRCGTEPSDLYQVTAGSAHLRAKPSSDSKSLAEPRTFRLLKRVSNFSRADTIDARAGVWLEVKTLQGKQGYAFDADLEAVEIAPKAFWRIENENPLAGDCEDAAEETDEEEREACRAHTRKVFARLGERIRETKNGFRITTGTGKVLAFQNRKNGFATRLYRPLYAFEDRPYLLIQVTLYEGGEYILVNLNSGNRTKLWDAPVPGPDDRRLVVASAAVAHKPNGIQIVELNEKGARIVFERELDWFPAAPRWTGTTEIEVDRYRNFYPPDIIDGEMTRNRARLVYRNEAWEFAGR